MMIQTMFAIINMMRMSFKRSHYVGDDDSN